MLISWHKFIIVLYRKVSGLINAIVSLFGLWNAFMNFVWLTVEFYSLILSVDCVHWGAPTMAIILYWAVQGCPPMDWTYLCLSKFSLSWLKSIFDRSFVHSIECIHQNKRMSNSNSIVHPSNPVSCSSGHRYLPVVLRLFHKLNGILYIWKILVICHKAFLLTPSIILHLIKSILTSSIFMCNQ